MNINETLRYLNVGLPVDILRHKLHGDFAEAIRLIDLRLQDETLPQGLRCCMIAQREIMLRLPPDYPFSRAEALAILREDIPDFTDAEFSDWEDAGRIGWIYVNGEKRYFKRFYATLLKTEAAIASRAGKGMTEPEAIERGKRLDASMRHMKEQGQIAYRFRIRTSVRLHDEHFTPGMFLRVHLPLPAACEQQSDIQIEKLFPENGQIAPIDAPQRTVCWEKAMDENQAFTAEYSYTFTSKYHDTHAIIPSPIQPDFCLEEEAPHIVFTPYIRELVAALTKGLTDPLEKARAFYDFITLNMKYSFQPEYFVLESIAENCARSYTGDCGVFALLFITLCRCAGIPARWQSCMAAEPGDCGCHDWAQFYIAPVGWLYADPSYGVSANRSGNEERRQFYFGNLDGWRMVANSAYQHGFTVEKQHWRADPYDNQTGEMETADRGFATGQYEWTMDVVECTPV